MDSALAGKVVLVTGASAGIGEAASRLFAARGARMVLVARRMGPLEALAEELRAQGAEVLCLSADVQDSAACEQLIRSTEEHFGGLDVLVNNAGDHVRGDFEVPTPGEVARMVDVNLRAPLVLCSVALPGLRARKGAIVNVASLAGQVPVPGSAVYGATKAGLRAFSFALAEELRGSGVRVAVVSPGPVSTGFILSDPSEVSPLTFSQPMSSAGTVAEAVVQAAIDGKAERSLPRASGVLTLVGYVFPGLGRALRPMLKRRGARVREQLIKERAPSHNPGS